MNQQDMSERLYETNYSKSQQFISYLSTQQETNRYVRPIIMTSATRLFMLPSAPVGSPMALSLKSVAD